MRKQRMSFTSKMQKRRYDLLSFKLAYSFSVILLLYRRLCIANNFPTSFYKNLSNDSEITIQRMAHYSVYMGNNYSEEDQPPAAAA